MVPPMDISLFDYELNSNLIAQKPCVPRDNSRLLNCTKEVVEDLQFNDLPSILNPGDVLVINNTKVIPSRLFGKRDQVNMEVTLHMKTNNNTWKAFLKPGRKCKVNDTIVFQNDLKAKVIEKYIEGDVLLHFNKNDGDVLEDINYQGQMPLPPYIKRNKKNESDNEDYQTIFAEEVGAVATPTAGLHFTDELIHKLKSKGVLFAPITLHVGVGTFLPVKVNNVHDHKMHKEWGCLSENTSNIINKAIQKNKRIISVGTTSLRILETVARSKNGLIKPWSGVTDLFITPGFKFKIVDLLITNFHLPKSTLLMLVSAFHGKEKTFERYKYAIEKKYRFFSYGDSCIFSRENYF